MISDIFTFMTWLNLHPEIAPAMKERLTNLVNDSTFEIDLKSKALVEMDFKKLGLPLRF